MREWRPAEMNPGDFHTFDVSAQFLFVGCSGGRVLRLDLETGEERYSNDLGGGGVQEIVTPAAEKLSQLFATTARFVAVVAFGMQHGKTFRQVVDSDKKVGPAQRA